MEFLTQLFGNLTSGVIRLAVAVGIIAAVGVFILKPILDTTDNAVNKANSSFEKSFQNTGIDTKAIEAQVNKALEDVNKHTQVEVERTFHSTTIHGDPQKILHCVQRANGNVKRIERCAKKF